MKKFLGSLIILFILVCAYYLQENSSYMKVLQINSPCSIFVDTNKNLIFDETEPIVSENIFFIEKDKNYSDDKILGSLRDNEKFFLNYFADRTAKDILNNKYVTLNDNKIFVNNKSYEELLLSTDYFYTNDDNSKRKLVDYIKSINLDDYVLLNTRSKKYHTLNCIEGRKSKNIKIIKKDSLTDDITGCRICSLPQTKEEVKQKKKVDELRIKSKVSETYSKGDIKVYFLDINKIWRSSSKCDTLACKDLKKEIDNAQNTIDFAIYGINNQDEIFSALIKAQERGVKIRWVTDFDKKEGNYYQDTEKLKLKLKDYKTDEEYDNNNRAAIMHNKFFIFDDKKVWTGSSNISGTDITEFNSNINVLIFSPELAKIYKKEFEQMYSGKFHTQKEQTPANKIVLNSNTKISAYFSPQDSPIRKQIIPMIREAKEYIYIPIFFITKKELIEELKNAHNRGVEIKIIDDATNAHSKYSIHKTLREYGIKVKTENYAGKMHTKTIIIDDKYSIIGSMNFTNNGEQRNDENVVIIENKDIAVYLKQCFIYLWAKIPAKYETFDPYPESLESIGSCYDGIDNDYDGKIDGKDEGCKQK